MKKYSHNSIFGPGPNPALNACVGDNGGPYRYNAYGEGFFHGTGKTGTGKNGAYLRLNFSIFMSVRNFYKFLSWFSEQLIDAVRSSFYRPGFPPWFSYWYKVCNHYFHQCI